MCIVSGRFIARITSFYFIPQLDLRISKNTGKHACVYNFFMKLRKQAARVLIAIVVFFNLQSAIVFLIDPARYSPGFEVSGVPGQALVRGLGILFIMWNVPYLVALYDPIRHYISHYETIAMQAIGLAGESILLGTLPGSHPALQMTATRFIVFDGVGLIFLIVAALLIIRFTKTLKSHK